MAEEVIVVQGGMPLTGTIKVGGAKNSVLKLMAASLMTSGVTVLENVPAISDVFLMVQVLETLGAKVEKGDHSLTIDTTTVDSYRAPYELVAKMRASTAVLGPLIARFGQAEVAMPGGCKIGTRKLDLHFSGLESLGAEFELDHGYINASTPHGLHGAKIFMDFPSVGATENLMMASCFAEGTSVIENAAREPEIVDLACFLNEMGAQVEGAGSPTITVQGVKELHPVTHRTCGDRIEAGTFLCAGALCGGPLRVEGIDPSFLEMALAKLRETGCNLDVEKDAITISHRGPFKPFDIQTLPHPGFPTDLQAQFMAIAVLAQGTSVISENVFENRFMFADEVRRMGADITIEGHHAIVTGVDRLSGAQVASPDLRGGAALVLAGLVAEGETCISSIEHIDRGYEDLTGKLSAVGARISRATI